MYYDNCYSILYLIRFFKICFEYYYIYYVFLFLLQVVYYIEVIGVDNYVVREVVCACIVEFGFKVYVGREGMLFNFLKEMNKFKILFVFYKFRRMFSFQMFEQLVVEFVFEIILGLLKNKNDYDFVFLQIDRDVVRFFIFQLLEVFLICFNDDSWFVRDGMFI